MLKLLAPCFAPTPYRGGLIGLIPLGWSRPTLCRDLINEPAEERPLRSCVSLSVVSLCLDKNKTKQQNRAKVKIYNKVTRAERKKWKPEGKPQQARQAALASLGLCWLLYRRSFSHQRLQLYSLVQLDSQSPRRSKNNPLSFISICILLRSS